MNDNKNYRPNESGYPPNYMYPRAYPPPWGYPYIDPARAYMLRCRKNATKQLNVACALLYANTAISAIIGVVVMVAVGFIGANKMLESDWFIMFATVMSMVVPFALYLVAKRKEIDRYLRFERVGFIWAALFIIAGTGVSLMGNIPSSLVKTLIPALGDQPVATQYSELTWYMFILKFISIAVLTPLAEEMVFRGVIFSSLRKYGAGFAITASSLLFALVHMDISIVIFAFIAGAAMCIAYEKTNNLWIPIIIHGINNGFAVISSYLHQVFGDSVTLYLNLAAYYIPMALGVAALLILKNKLSGPSGYAAQQRLPASLGTQAMLRSPLAWGLAVGAVIYSVGMIIGA